MRKARKLVISFLIVLMVGLLLSVNVFSDEKIAGSTQEYVIIQSHDVHGMYLPKEEKGGMEAWATEIISLRKEYPNRVIVLDSGDVNTGTLISDVPYKGVFGGAMIEFMNELGYNVWTPGNHEFDKGQKNCLGYAKLADFPTVCANIVYTATGEPFFPPYTIIDVDGLEIGVIGVMEEIFKMEITKEHTEGLDVLSIASVVATYAKFLEPRTDLIFVLVQGGMDDTRLAAQPPVDLILPAEAPEGGAIAGAAGNVTKINDIYVAGGPSGKDGGIGKIIIEVKDNEIISVNEEDLWLPAEEAKPPLMIKAMVEKYQGMIDKEFGEVIGQLKTDWIRAEPESNIGDWQTDVMRAKTGTDFAFQNSGGIRKDLPAGPITKMDIMEISPFHNTLATFTVSGAELKHILEWNFERGWDLLQMSGITCSVDMNKKYGERVSDIYVNEESLELDKVYTGTFNDYGIGHDKDKYFDLEAHNKINTYIPLAQTEIEAVIDQKVIDIKMQNRIKVKPAAEVRGTCLEVDSFGNVKTDITEEQVKAAGFELGDIINIKIGEKVIEAPFVITYGDVSKGKPLARISKGNLLFAINYGNFSETYEARKEALIKVVLKGKASYKEELEIRHLERPIDRESYKSDEEFTNFRMVKYGDIADKTLYRSCHPAAKDDPRTLYGSNLVEEKGINTIINLTDTEEDLEEDYECSQIYKEIGLKGNIIAVKMGLEPKSETFCKQLNKVIKFMIVKEPPYLIHCMEGKDRAGIVSAIFEAAMGATLKEVEEDYMKSFENYYGIEAGDIKYSLIQKQFLDILTEINDGAEVTEENIKAVIENYLLEDVGLSEGELKELKDKLSKEIISSEINEVVMAAVR